MNKFFKHVLLPVFIALTSTAAMNAAADAQYYYYDGNNKIPLALDPALVMDFNASAAPSSVKAALPAATVAETVGKATLYNIPQNQQNSAAVTGLFMGNNGVSPVFYRGAASTAGQLLALPGGVIVNFNAEWSDIQVRDWVAAKGYSIQQRLNISGNWYVIRTAAGLASLDAGNAIHESGEVISASPNWWRGVVAH